MFASLCVVYFMAIGYFGSYGSSQMTGHPFHQATAGEFIQGNLANFNDCRR